MQNHDEMISKVHRHSGLAKFLLSLVYTAVSERAPEEVVSASLTSTAGRNPR